MLYILILADKMGANAVLLQLDDYHRQDLGIAELKP